MNIYRCFRCRELFSHQPYVVNYKGASPSHKKSTTKFFLCTKCNQMLASQEHFTNHLILDNNTIIDEKFNTLLDECKQDPTVKLLKFKQIATSLYPRIRLAEYTQEQKKKVLDEFENLL